MFDEWKAKLFYRLMILLSLIAAPASLGGCAAIDGFAPRVGDYNTQTSESKTGVVLVNIVRAAHAEPLQFTDVSGMVGNNGLSASVTPSVPLKFQGGRSIPLAQTFLNVSGTLSASGSSQFSVANLNTQEFYYGLQSPIKEQTLASYMSAGFDPRVLFPLVISEIEYTRGGRRAVLPNDPRTANEFNTFYGAILRLIEAGLSAEQVSDTTQVGPDLSEREARDVRLLAAVVTSTAAEAPTLTKTPDGGGFSLAKRNARYRFCFDPVRASEKRFGVYHVAPSAGPGRWVSLVTAGRVDRDELTFQLQAGDYCGANAVERAKSKLFSQSLKFNLRSVQGIIYYLGVIARYQLDLAALGAKDGAQPDVDARRRLFSIDRGSSGANRLAVSYRGHAYGVNVDPSGDHDRSSRVLQFLTEMLALQSSAKNLPAPNIVTLVGQ